MSARKMSPAHRAQALSLAVRYHAFHDAKTDNGIQCWGKLLIESMEETGIELHDPKNIAALMEAAKYRQRQAALRLAA